MDFSTTEAAQDLGGLVSTIVDAVCTPEHQRQLDGLDQRFDRELWSKLIDADILSTAAPESLGGGGFGVLEQTAVLVGLGRQLAAVPYLDSVVLAAGATAAIYAGLLGMAGQFYVARCANCHHLTFSTVGNPKSCPHCRHLPLLHPLRARHHPRVMTGARRDD